MTASERPHDTGGPRPENQRKRTEIRGPRRALVGMLVTIGLVAVVFAVLRRSNDQFLGLPAGYLAGPSGLFLTSLIAGTQAIAAALLILHAARGRLVAALAAFVVIGSAAVLMMSMSGVGWLPALLFFIGLIELLLVAASTPRKTAHRKHVPGRR